MMYFSCRSELTYTTYMQDFYTQNISHISTSFCIHFVYKIYTKYLFGKCVPHFDKLWYTFCVKNLAGIVLLILYAKCISK